MNAECLNNVFNAINLDKLTYGTKLYNSITSKEDQLCLQRVINSIKEWCDKWLLELNISKCKTISYCMKNVIDTEYFINDGCMVHEIEKLTNMKDLGVIFDSELSFHNHIQLKINKAYSILGLIKINFIYMLFIIYVLVAFCRPQINEYY